MMIKKFIKIKIEFFLILLSFLAYSQDEKIQRAFDEYQKNNYSEAIRLYKEIIDEGFVSAELYYNLGNAYFKNKDIPSAILYYERAKRLAPADEDINFNLKVAEQNIVDKVEPLPQVFFIVWYNSVVNLFNTDGWAILSISFFVIMFVLLIFYFFSKSLSIRKNSFYASIVFFVLSVITFIFAREQYSKLTSTKEAIIFTPTVTVKSAPDPKATDIFVIHEGLKVTITDQIGDWSEIRIANGSKGWIKNTDYVII